MSLVTLSGNDPRQYASDFWNSVEQKINFSLGTAIPTDPTASTYHQNRRKALFGSLLTETALEWFNTVEPTKTSTKLKEISKIDSQIAVINSNIDGKWKVPLDRKGN